MNLIPDKFFKKDCLKKEKIKLNNYLEISFYLKELINTRQNEIILVCPNSFQANHIYSFLSLIEQDASVLLFPEEEILYASTYSSSSDLLAQRLSTLIESFNQKKKIIITSVIGLCRYLPEPNFFKKSFLHANVGSNFSIENCANTLVSMGYKKVNHVSQTFEFAVRGDILDIYSINSEYPIRISVFDNKVEFISFFKVETQITFKRIEDFYIYPASDIIFQESEIESIKSKIVKSQIKSEFFDNFLFDIFNQNNYKYYSVCQNNNYSLLDYFKSSLVVFQNFDDIKTSYQTFKKQSEEFLSDFINPLDEKKGLSLVHDFLNIEIQCDNKIKIYKDELNVDTDYFPNRILDLNLTKIDHLFEFVKSAGQIYKKVVVCVEDQYQLNIVEEYLKKNESPYSIYDHLDFQDDEKFTLCIFPLIDSFEIIGKNTIVISTSKVFGLKRRKNLIKNKFKRGVIINSCEEISSGDYLVHENYGIGRFVDICTLEIDKKKSDYLKVEYAKGQILYVPLNQFKLIRRYRGAEGFEPKLNSLNDAKWSRTKELVEQRSLELSKKLKELYKKRAALKGHVFESDDDLQKEFESDFPYDLTTDQTNAISSIKKEMEDGKLIDYLVCGDVGFGKTEVAFRAIFKTILNGFQVALLCPTTVLAKQHYLLAQERFEKYGIKVELFSRLITESKKKKILDNLNNGLVDFIIGTHSLLSNKIKFKNLGLLVVDEEQRFGVEQKEKIKSLKADINVITLSATPIPRTLELSLSGIRDISIINTPPKERSPVQTYVLPFRKEIIKEVIQKELNRDGQIYYVYNDVQTILERAHFIEDLVPQAKIGILHGQMDKNYIDKTLLDFFDGRINLLICSSIIENGLDVPNANLLIVENSDLFGLAQLYQIKGRIGRGSRIGYAYLTYNDKKIVTKSGQERLKSIQQFTDLGSGYKIAQKDLVIRGAGNIFGREQAGFIDALGVDLYFQIINNAVKKAKETKPTPSKINKINLEVDGYFPDDFVAKNDKVDLYSKILNCSSVDEVNTVEKEIIDIYGKIPLSAKDLFTKKKVECILENEIIEKVENNPEEIAVIFKRQKTDFEKFKKDIQNLNDRFEDDLSIFYSLKFLEVKFIKKEKWINRFYNVLVELMKLFEN